MHDHLFTLNDDETITVSVHAQPGAGKSAVVGTHGDALKIRVAAPPERGRANDAVRALLAEELGVAPSAVELVSGPASRSKRFKITGVEADDMRRALDRLLEPGNASRPGGVRDRNR